MSRMVGVVVAVSLSLAAAARADTALIGTVTSTETKKPLQDVIVTATSPAAQGELVVVTDAQGQFRIPNAPPGIYTVRFDSEEFKPYSRTDIQLRPDRTVRITVALRPVPPGEMIGWWGCWAPIVDVGSATTGLSVDLTSTQRLALNRPTDKRGAARSFEGLVELVPGARSDAYGVSIHGASAFENGYVVDGLSTNDPLLGVNALPLSVEFLQDFSVLTGGHMPEYGRATGGLLRAWTRSGSNEFHGSVFGNTGWPR